MNKTLNIKKTVIAVIVLNLTQLVLVIGLIVYEFRFNKGLNVTFQYGELNLLFGLVLAIILFNSFMMLRDAYLLNQVRTQDEMVRESLTQVENLNNTLRAQRHDFMNHLQVIYSLVELHEWQEAQDYLDRVYTDIQKVSQVLKTVNPAINALLQAKIHYGEKRGIKVGIKITSRLKELPVPDWEMCRILGNLIDNAIDALKEKSGERLLNVEIFEDLKGFGFMVKNNGPAIPKNLWDKIFQPNFTTKGDEGEGMGLAIIKELMDNYQGEIKVSSDENFTVFEGWIPKKIS